MDDEIEYVVYLQQHLVVCLFSNSMNIPCPSITLNLCTKNAKMTARYIKHLDARLVNLVWLGFFTCWLYQLYGHHPSATEDVLDS